MPSIKPTTIRLEPALKKEVMRIAKEKGLTFSQAVTVALRALTDGIFFLSVGISEYPDGYKGKLDGESKETMKLYREGKIKGHTSGKEMLSDILGTNAE